ncbi:hypothetical protein DL98DRAFT_570752 [Cadophora sp. DSE1049]|nr:hypothetical protein DL98DRAFT_570752 [Cadophora sp. DSE1049]
MLSVELKCSKVQMVLGKVLADGRRRLVASLATHVGCVVYVHAASFHHELYAYQILTSNASIPVPRFYEQVVLPSTRSAHLRWGYRHLLGWVLERLKGPLLGDILNLLDTPQRTTLRSQTQAGLADLHQLGISHRDLKGNNIMFRTQEQKDWVFIDFGEARFRFELSAKAWKKACAYDQADLSAIFDDADAKYPPLLISSMLAAPIPSPASVPTPVLLSSQWTDCLRNHPNPTLTRDEFQQHLSSVLELAIRLPREAIALVSSTLTTFPSPIPSLAQPAIAILKQAGAIDCALDQLDVQLAQPYELPLTFRAHFYSTKIAILSLHGSLEECISTLEEGAPGIN